jgi:hypothetical protein
LLDETVRLEIRWPCKIRLYYPQITTNTVTLTANGFGGGGGYTYANGTDWVTLGTYNTAWHLYDPPGVQPRWDEPAVEPFTQEQATREWLRVEKLAEERALRLWLHAESDWKMAERQRQRDAAKAKAKALLMSLLPEPEKERYRPDGYFEVAHHYCGA